LPVTVLWPHARADRYLGDIERQVNNNVTRFSIGSGSRRVCPSAVAVPVGSVSLSLGVVAVS
jgi:hypothetical protein